jgi:signal transduction histidine kinase
MQSILKTRNLRSKHNKRRLSGPELQFLKFAIKVNRSASIRFKGCPFKVMQKIIWYLDKRHGFLPRFALSLVVFALSLLLRESLTPLIVDQDPFMFFAPAVLFSTYIGGLTEGVLAWLVGLLLGDYMFTGARFSFGPYGPAQITLMSTYSFTALTAVFLIQALKRLKLRAESYGRALEEEVARRKGAEADLQQAQESLRKHADTLEISVRQRTRDLEETVEHLEGVLYHLAHDLRSPLRAMAGYSALMREHYQPKPGLKDEHWPEHIIQAAERMDSLIKDLLAYGKLGHAPFPCELQDLEKPIAKALGELRIQVHDRGAQIRVDRPLRQVWGNSEGLYQVFLQLLSNALKFVPPGVQPKIRIWTEEAGDKTRIWVEDNGVGVEPPHTKRIFRVFEQLQGGEFGGHGIGLAMVRTIISRMEGEVGVISEPNQGSRFWILLNAEDLEVKSFAVTPPKELSPLEKLS